MRTRRNKQHLPKLPDNAELVACTWGFGKDDYLYVALAFIPHKEGEDEGMDQFVTWRGNSSVAIPPEVGEGHYMLRMDKDEDEWAQAAWDDFANRSRFLALPVPNWLRLEREGVA